MGVGELLLVEDMLFCIVYCLPSEILLRVDLERSKEKQSVWATYTRTRGGCVMVSKVSTDLNVDFTRSSSMCPQ